MRLAIGSYLFENAECLITYNGGQRLYSPRGRATGLLRTWIIEGEILRTTQATIETRRREIENALAIEGNSARLLADDGSTTYQLDSQKGVRVLELAWLQEENSAHFATALPFRIRLQGEEVISDGDPLVFYTEEITRIGNGGPRVVWPELQNGPSIPQTTASHTNVTIIQRGEAVGSFAYPFFNPPLFPDNLQNPDEATSRVAPTWDGLALVNHTVRWNYIFVFNSAEPLPFPIVR
jgi:hypothetical protein